MDLWISRKSTQIGWVKASRKPMNSWDVSHQLVQDFATERVVVFKALAAGIHSLQDGAPKLANLVYNSNK